MHPDLSQTPTELPQDLLRVSQSLRDSVRRLLDSVPNGPYRAQELARVLGVKKDVSSRLLIALGKADPIAVMYYMPGPEGLRRVVHAARGLGTETGVCEAVDAAVMDFDRLIKHKFGTRAALDAVISEILPDARSRVEMGAKQSLYKNSAILKGVQVDTSLASFLVHPAAEDPKRKCDVVTLAGLLGLRRLRPGVPIKFTERIHPDAKDQMLPEHAERDIEGPLLREFCTPWPLPITTERRDGRLVMNLGDTGIGCDSAVNVVLGVAQRGSPQYRQPSPDGRRLRSWVAIERYPARLMVLDVLVHMSLWRDEEFYLRAYETAVTGTVDPNREPPEAVRLDLAETIQPLGVGFERFRIAEVSNYVEMLRHVCTRMGWDPNSFRGYRCRVPFPFYGSEVCMCVDLSEPPVEEG